MTNDGSTEILRVRSMNLSTGPLLFPTQLPFAEPADPCTAATREGRNRTPSPTRGWCGGRARLADRHARPPACFGVLARETRRR